MEWKATAPAWAETVRSSSASHRSSCTSKGEQRMLFFGAGIGIVITKSWTLISLRPEESFLTIFLTVSYVFLYTGESDSGWPRRIDSYTIQKWNYGNLGSVPYACPGAMCAGGAVLTGDAGLLTWFLPQLGFKLFLNSDISTDLLPFFMTLS